jgi:hypothetical protein
MEENGNLIIGIGNIELSAKNGRTSNISFLLVLSETKL